MLIYFSHVKTFGFKPFFGVALPHLFLPSVFGGILIKYFNLYRRNIRVGRPYQKKVYPFSLMERLTLPYCPFFKMSFNIFLAHIIGKYSFKADAFVADILIKVQTISNEARHLLIFFILSILS